MSPSALGVECSALNVSPAVTRHRSRSGVALVITLILLSVTLIMAVAFLAVARRERNAVSTTTDTATARLAAEAALAAAQAQIAANILSSTNVAAFNFHLLVSTNYINAAGYDPTWNGNGANPANVNYDYQNDAGHTPLTVPQMEQNIANLLFLPRAPVYAYNRQTGSNEFRYFLDLNRNGRFEDSGDQLPNVENGLSGFVTNGVTSQVGDPQWIGVLERPDQPHGPNNRFIARYAFLAQPIGNSLDLNHLHNYAKRLGSDSFYRNQGVGSWEINLGAFLADLNTNQWFGYNYALLAANGLPDLNVANAGKAFDDARALLLWRYNGNYNNLARASQLFPNAANVFPYDNIDAYSDGGIQFSTTNINESLLPDNTALSWAGAENPNRFFSLPSDLFDAAKSYSVGIDSFTNRLWSGGTNNATYDRYTLYRMLDQLGTESTADSGKLNLNYDNTDGRGNVIPGAETNQVAWTPLGFFTNAADRLLRYYSTQWATNYVTNSAGFYVPVLNQQYVATFNTNQPFGVTHIPVLVSNQFVYSSAVNRLLQLAANMYDASTNGFYPSVFRPKFQRSPNGDVYINGYVEIPNVSAVGSAPLDTPVEATDPTLTPNAVFNAPRGNIYGVPWIIGAKKGLPNFNQFYMRNLVAVTRKLQVTRTTLSSPIETNQMFVMSVTNRIGFSFWNSYNTNYIPASGSVGVYFRGEVSMGITNQNGSPPILSSTYGNPTALFPLNFSFVTNSWPGAAWNLSKTGSDPTLQTAVAGSFISGYWDFQFLPESQFKYAGGGAGNFVSSATPQWEKGIGFVPVFPEFGLATTNRIQAFILDGNRVIDYVQFGGPNGVRSISSEIADTAPTGAGMWNTNFFGSGANPPTWGVHNQIEGAKNSTILAQKWKTPIDMPSFVNTPDLAAKYFKAFFTGDPGDPVAYLKGVAQYNTNTSLQVPYTPTRYAWNLTLWQANDPLVHYLASDLNTYTMNVGQQKADDLTASAFSLSNPQLNSVVDRYQPWGRGIQMDTIANSDKNHYNLAYRDPLVWGSDYWDFPAGKYPSVGWLGRVHRGTPWQTVYLKATNIFNYLNPTLPADGARTWAEWTGNTRSAFNPYLNVNQYYDAGNADPVQDRFLFDLFTTRLNDNGVKGALSVNQTHIAAWSAVLSGVVGLTNITGSPSVPSVSKIPVITNFVILPAGPDGTNSAIGRLLNGPNGINATRANFANADGLVGAFEHVGDILRTPALTEQSPFLNVSDADHRNYDISDQLYEWLPQQVMGLLRGSSAPRYVVYCYGQTLRPAPDGTVLSGNLFNLVTNYQVTAESAARVVLRVDDATTPTPKVIIESYNVLPPD